MRKSVVSAVLHGTFLGVVGTSGVALAEESATAGRVRAGLFLGGNYLSSENELGNSFFDDQVPESGFLLGGRGSYLLLDSIALQTGLNPQLNIELEAKYAFSSTAGNAARASQSSPVLGWRSNAVLDLYPQKKIVPFVLLGFGGETVLGSNKFMRTPDSDFTSYFGTGARIKVAEHLDVRGDFRWALTASREDTLSSLFEFHVGVTYEFGKSKAPIVIVKEVVQPQTVVETAVLDKDRDGIADIDDACPELPEIINKIDDSDGCPEVDSDNDGLLGSRDSCPAAAEDMDGYRDEDGCPDPDNDGDGMPDVVDQCPSEGETINGYEDTDGCPDTVPDAVQAFTGRIKGIAFRSNSARILKKSHPTLNKAFNVLKQYPAVRIEISGHTDDRGKIEKNRALSRKRADYVKWYLVDKGIAADRIETVGYGPDKAISDNSTKEGRRLNRRIEFKLLQ